MALSLGEMDIQFAVKLTQLSIFRLQFKYMGNQEIETRSMHPDDNNYKKKKNRIEWVAILIKKIKKTYVSVQLPDKAGEVAVLEVFRQKICLELWDIPDHETVIAATPRHH